MIGGPKLCIRDLMLIFLKPMVVINWMYEWGWIYHKRTMRGSIGFTMNSINTYFIKARSLWRHAHSTFFFIRDMHILYRRCISSSYLLSIAGTYFTPVLAFNEAKKSLSIQYAYICKIRSLRPRVTLSKSIADVVERSI